MSGFHSDACCFHQSAAVKEVAFIAIAGEFMKGGMLGGERLHEPGRSVAKAIIESQSLSISFEAWLDLVPDDKLRQKLLAPNVFAFRDGDLHFESFLAEMYARSRLAAEPSWWWWWRWW